MLLSSASEDVRGVIFRTTDEQPVDLRSNYFKNEFNRLVLVFMVLVPLSMICRHLFFDALNWIQEEVTYANHNMRLL